MAGTEISAFEADHPSGAPALILRLAVAGKIVAYTGDTAWTPAIPAAAAGADLLSHQGELAFDLAHDGLVLEL